MRTNFLGLEAFLAIAEWGSFRRAAAHLNLSQTALSHRMRKFEDDVGVKLLARTTRQTSLTAAGAELLARARHTMDELTDSFEDLRSHARERQTRLAIGCIPVIATQLLPDILPHFVERHPGVQLSIADNSVPEIAQMVEEAQIEFGVTSVPANRWDLEIQPVAKEPFILLCRDDDPLAQRRAVKWADLQGRPLVGISRQTINRGLIDDALGSRRDAMLWKYEVQHLATAAGLVAAGLAVSVVPSLAVGTVSHRHLVAVPLQSPSVARTIGIISRRDRPLSPAGETLASMVRQRLTATLGRSAA